jgi:DNA-directed RNA polymerase specialized sigma24 family protein
LLRNDPPEWFVDSFIAEGSDLLDSIPEEGSLRVVTKMRMEGYRRQEIADALHISHASVKRKLSRIREHLEHVLSEEASQ